jgi:hypothetical protein
MKRILAILTLILFAIPTAPAALAADTSPPQLVDFTIQADDFGRMSADIANSDASAKVRFIISDDSEIALPNLLIKSLSTTQMTSFATVKELSRTGKLVSYEATAVIKVGQSPRVWEWILYPLKDVLGNSSSGFGPGGSWESKIDVTDLQYTSGILHCERNFIRWNSKVKEFIDNEKRLNYPQEFAIARLKSKTPVEIFDLNKCTNMQYDPISLWAQIDELDYLLDMHLLAYNERQERETERLNSELIAQMELKQKENEKQAALDKILVDVKARAEAEANSMKLKDELNSDSVKLSNLIDKLLNTSLTTSIKNELKSVKSNLSSLTTEFNGINLLELQKFNMYKTNLSNLNMKYLKAYPAASKKTTITCVKGKLTKKITAVKPVCPKGYKKK